MIVWGTISAATAGCKTFGGLIAVRFMLGFVEAAYFVSLSAPVSPTSAEFPSPGVYTISHAGIPGRSWDFERPCFTPVLSSAGHFLA
jgi:hypothetical protein